MVIDFNGQVAIVTGGPGLEVTVQQWDRAMNINARGMFFMMQQTVEQSMKRSGGGSIVSFSSMAGIRGMHPPMCSAWYSASKGAVVAATITGQTIVVDGGASVVGY